jgi:hypothetical protein
MRQSKVFGVQHRSHEEHNKAQRKGGSRALPPTIALLLDAALFVDLLVHVK